jgi:6-phosphogluconolactonase (cycloisomerase 2 family)
MGTSADIQGASLTSSGVFANLSPYTPPILPSNSVNNMAIADGQFLYIPMNGFSNVQAFSINRTTGALTTVAGSPFPAQAADDSLTVDPSGHFLFVGGRFASSISVYQINATTGALTPVAGSPFQSFNLVFANSLTVDSTGKFLYVGQTFGSNPVVAFSINQTTGALSEIAGSPFPLGVSVLQADPTANFLLGLADDSGASGDKHIHVFSIDPNSGALSAVAGAPVTTTSTPFALAVHPTGGFVYVSTADDNQLVTNMEGFQIDATTGALNLLTGSPFNLVVAECQFGQSGADAVCLSAAGLSVLNVDPNSGAFSHTVPDLTAPNAFPFAITE